MAGTSLRTLTDGRALLLVAVLAGGLCGCAGVPDDAFRLPETALETRAMQTRDFEDVSEAEILSASASVLQDLGYAIDEVEKELGVLSASKRADATNEAEVVGKIALDAVTCLMTLLFACDNENYLTADAEQDIRLTLVVQPDRHSDTRHSVRVTMQRVVWDRDGRISEQATVSQPEVYQAFFDKLSKSVFIEQEGV